MPLGLGVATPISSTTPTTRTARSATTATATPMRLMSSGRLSAGVRAVNAARIAAPSVRFGCLAHRVPYRRSHPGLRLDASGGDSASERGVVFFVLLGVCVGKVGYGVVELGRVA
jgi:hypothetical protein